MTSPRFEDISLVYILVMFVSFPIILHAQGGDKMMSVGKQTNKEGGGNYTWQQPFDGYASGGVYNSSGQLIRTLFSHIYYNKGAYTKRWDGLADDSSFANAPTYSIKVETSELTPKWEGVAIGSTCDSLYGPHHARCYNYPTSCVVVGDTSYWSLLYCEAFAGQFYRSVARPQAGVSSYGPAGTYVDAYNCSDGKTIYHAMAGDNDKKWFVWGVIANYPHSNAGFSAGKMLKTNSFGTWNNVISVTTGADNAISAIAVQKAGRYLFVARAKQNAIVIYDKTTGDSVSTFAISTPQKLAVTTEGEIWVSNGTNVTKYIVTNSGGLKSTGTVVQTDYSVNAMSVSTSNSTLYVADVSNCLLKGYSNLTGSSLWVRGTQDGYKHDATVTNNKWYWRDSAGTKNTFIAFLPDNSYYLEDGENRRTLRFDSAGKYVSCIFLAQTNYHVEADATDSSRLFEGFREYHVDYTKPLGTTNGSWTLVKNWGYNFTTNIYNYRFNIINHPVTFPNKRTYCVLQSKLTNPFFNYVCELTNKGLQNTGVHVAVTAFFEADGSLVVPNYVRSGSSLPYKVNRYPLAGMDAAGIPIWSKEGIILASIADTTIGAFKTVITNSMVVGYDISAAVNHIQSTDYHLEFIDIRKNQLQAKALRGTPRFYSGPFPDGGYFDNGNGVNVGLNGAGGTVLGYRNLIAANYHGEFYKQAQTNMWFIYDATTGLEVAQFGFVVNDWVFAHLNPPGIAGNTITGSLVSANGHLYLYHNDESFGIHRWQLDNFSSVSVQTAAFPSTKQAVPDAGIDLLAGYNRFETIENGKGGWHMTPAATGKDTYFYGTLGRRSYDQFARPDLTIAEKDNVADATDTIARELPVKGAIGSWTLSSDALFNLFGRGDARSHYVTFVDVCDVNGKAIARFSVNQTDSNQTLYKGNGEVMFDRSKLYNPYLLLNYYQPFVLSAANGIISIQYGDAIVKTKSTADNGALWNRPSYFRVYYKTNQAGANYGDYKTFKNLRFYSGN